MTEVREPDDLYALPLEEFTAARNELARSLKAAGEAGEAARVKKLKKPPVSAWAVNRLARDDPGAIGRLLELVDRLKEASSAADIHRLGSERRELVAKLTRRAGELAEAAGHPASPATLQRVTQTLQAGAEEAERDLLGRGALPDDLAPAGFDALGDLASLDAFTQTGAGPGPDDDAAEAEELERVATEAEGEAERLTEEAERAEAVALKASEAASEARRRAREAREQARKAARAAR